MSTGPSTLWTDKTPRELARSGDEADQHQAYVIHHSRDVGGPVEKLLPRFQQDPDLKTAVDVGFFIAGYDAFMRGCDRPSNRALGWMVIAGSMGSHEANLVLTIAHLLDLRERVQREAAEDGSSRGEPLDGDGLHALWSAYRCAWRMEDADIVRKFCMEALQARPSPEDIGHLIGRIDQIDMTPIFLPVEPFRENRGTGARREDPVTAAATVRVVKSIGDAESLEGRRVQRTYGHLTEPMAMTEVPGSAETVREVLMSWFPWMENAVEAVYQDLRLSEVRGQPWLHLRPLLLEGPPGCGKSFFAEKLADLLGGRLARTDAGGSRDNRLLAGTARGWSGAQPAYPVLAMTRTSVANPLILIDEIDKAASSHNGSVHETLLGMLDAKTAARWPDECLMSECDLSHVSWLLTANDGSVLPKPLKSRLRRVHVDVPGERHADAALEALAADVRRQLEWPADKTLPIAPEVWNELRGSLKSGSDFRAVAGGIYSAIAHGNRRPQTVH